MQKIIVILICCFSMAIALAQSVATEQTRQIKTLDQQILSVKKDLSVKQLQRSRLQQELKMLEMQIGVSVRVLHLTLAQLNKQHKTLQVTRASLVKLQQQLIVQKQRLSRYIRSAYMLGRQQYLKVLLNQQNPNTMDRYITYYRYLTKARIRAIKTTNKTLAKLKQVQRNVQKQMKRLRHLNAGKLAQNQALLSQRTQRQHLLKEINASISTRKVQLKNLLYNKDHLRQILHEIRTEKYFYSPGRTFSDARGRLPWPIQHFSVIQGYNEPVYGGALHTSGMELKAPMGTAIHAIYKGQIVFADWLRGYGLLVIVQHGKAFMTLYGHVESIYVTVGQTVAPGKVIATVGNSGGYQQAALYFELRHDGVALDPFRWLRRI